MNEPTKSRVTFWLSDEMMETVREIKEDIGIPQSKLIERAINEMIERDPMFEKYRKENKQA